MNFDQVLENGKEKLSKSKTFVLMSNFNELVSLNPGVQVTTEKTKDKRVRIIKKVSAELVSYHDSFKSPLKDFGDSIILLGKDADLISVKEKRIALKAELEKEIEAHKDQPDYIPVKKEIELDDISTVNAVDYLIDEAIAFSLCLNAFNEVVESPLVKNVQELVPYYKKTNLKPSKIKDALIKDLKMYAHDYGFEFSPLYVVQKFESKGFKF